MKKKLIAILLVVLLVFSFAACKKEETPPAGNNDTPVVDNQDDTQTSAPVAEEVMGITIPEFAITVNGVEITHETMADYAIYKVVATSVNSSGTESTVTYCGFALKDVIAAAGLSGEFTKITATANDGYSIEFENGAALIAENTTLLALTKNGDPFKDAPWFAPCTSATTGDYLKYMTTITL